MEVYWLEQAEADVPPENNWLSASEVIRLNAMRFAKRRADWRLGRWTAKRALAACLNVSGDPQGLRYIEIRPALSGAPEALFAGVPVDFPISLSHRAGVAACAVGLCGGALGCDLETIEPRSDAFVADYFTAEERTLIGDATPADRPCLLALLWSAKESALKALRAGLRLDTRSVQVSLCDAMPRRASHGEGGRGDPWLAVHSPSAVSSWRPLQVLHTDGQAFHGWWQHRDNLLRTLAASPPPAAPISSRMVTDQRQQIASGPGSVASGGAGDGHGPSDPTPASRT